MKDRERALAMAYRVRATDWPKRTEAIADAILEARAEEAERPTSLTILGYPVITNEQLLRAAELRSQKEPGC